MMIKTAVIYTLINVFGLFSAVVMAQENNEEAEETTQPKTITIDRSKIKITPPTNLNTLRKRDIEHYIKEDERQKLLVGPDEYITLQKDELTSSPKGVIILLPDAQHNVVSPKAIDYLRQSFPNRGWVTMAIQPPEKPENMVFQVTKDNMPETQTDDTTTNNQLPTPLTQYKQSLTALLTAVMEKAADYPGIFIVIAEGVNGALLTELYNNGKIPLPNALILLSSYLPEKDANRVFMENMAKSDYPILDLMLTRDSPWILTNKTLRKQLANKYIKVVYRQKILSARFAGYYPQQDLEKEIVGWLSVIGW